MPESNRAGIARKRNIFEVFKRKPSLQARVACQQFVFCGCSYPTDKNISEPRFCLIPLTLSSEGSSNPLQSRPIFAPRWEFPGFHQVVKLREFSRF